MVWAPESISRRFDADHLFGYENFSDKSIPSTRVKHLIGLEGSFTHLAPQLPGGPWHYLSDPVKIYPFIVVSDFGYVFASMGGAAGRMWTFWLFGWQVKIHTKYYWHI